MTLVRLAFFVVSLLAAVACDATGPTGDATGPLVSAIPFAPGEEFRYALFGDADVLIGRGTLAVRRDGDSLILEQRYEAADGKTSDTASVTVAAQTLQPRAMRRSATGDGGGEFSATYAADARKVEVQDGDKARSMDLPEHAYDNESSLWLWRTLPFAQDFEARYVSVNTVERSRQTVEVNVTSRQSVTVPAGTFDTWRLQIRNGRATRVAWINAAPPHQVVQWDNGAIIFRLESK